MSEYVDNLEKVMGIEVIPYKSFYIVKKDGKYHSLGHEFDDLLTAQLYIENSRIALMQSLWIGYEY